YVIAGGLPPHRKMSFTLLCISSTRIGADSRTPSDTFGRTASKREWVASVEDQMPSEATFPLPNPLSTSGEGWHRLRCRGAEIFQRLHFSPVQKNLTIAKQQAENVALAVCAIRSGIAVNRFR